MNDPEPIAPYADYPRALPVPNDPRRVNLARALSAGSIVAGLVTLILIGFALLVDTGYVGDNWVYRNSPWFILASWVASLWFGVRKGIPKRPSVVLAFVGGLIIFMLLFAQFSPRAPAAILATAGGALVYGVLSGVAAYYVKRSLQVS